MKKILIDCSTISAGGGIQVSISFIKDLIDCKLSKKFSIYSSRALYLSCKKQKIDIIKNFNDVRIRNLPYIFSIFLNSIWYQHFDVVFNIFGPPYFFFKPKKMISGLARPQLFYSDIFWEKRFIFKIINKIKNFIHKLIYTYRVDTIIVEAHHVKKKCDKIFKGNKKIFIVKNCLSSNFISSINKFRKINKIKFNNLLLYVGANYSHKNISILAPAINGASLILKKKIKLLTTFSHNDYKNLPSDIKKITINLGVVSSLQLKSVYLKSKAVIFPSLLECFSITPIEALYCKKPLIASKKDFITEFCKNVPYYFDPKDHTSISKAIVNCFNEFHKNDNRLKRGKTISKKYINSLIRSKKYLKIIDGNS